MAAPAKRLKKRSAANSVSLKPPEELVFFLDRQLGRHKMAGILRAAGLNVEIHDDHSPDELPASPRRDIVVTRDELAPFSNVKLLRAYCLNRLLVISSAAETSLTIIILKLRDSSTSLGMTKLGESHANCCPRFGQHALIFDICTLKH